MARDDLIGCEGCGKLTRPEKLSFDGDGRTLCTGCYQSHATEKATWLAKRPAERRKCEHCGNVVTASPEYVHPDGSPHALSRHHGYECECGRKFTIVAWPGLLGLGAMGAASSYLTGLLLQSDEYFLLLLTGSFTVFVIVGMLREIVLRRRYPRVR